MVGVPTGCSASFFYSVKIKSFKLPVVVVKENITKYNYNSMYQLKKSGVFR